MGRWNSLRCILLLLLALAGQATTALAQHGQAPPLFQLPPLDNDSLKAAELSLRQPGRAPRFACPEEVNIRPQTHGHWILTGDSAIWQLRLSSPGAFSLNLGFTEYYMPPGGQLFLSGPGQERAQGPFTPSDNEAHQQLWTPAFPGDELTITVVLPQAEQPHLRLWLTRINHDFMDFFAIATGACHLDVVCGEEDGWGEVDRFRDQIQSVAVYGQNGDRYCTGFLVNNTAQDCKPYFLTAYHCEVTPSVAPSVVVYWNYRNSYCRQPGTVASANPGNGSLNLFNTGAIFRSGHSPSDMALLELDDAVPDAAQAFFAGWDRSAAPPEDTLACIHHPDGAEKRISFAFTDAYTGSWGSGSQQVPNGNHLIVPNWSVGSTEIGSSGAPLFNRHGKAVGQLHGGGASCNNNAYDAFGWLRPAWEGGGTPATRLKDWLDPLQSNTMALDGRSLASCNVALFVEPAQQATCIPGQAIFSIDVAAAFSGPVSLSAPSLPSGVSAHFSPNPVPPGGQANLILSFALGADLPGLEFSTDIHATDGNSEAAATAVVYLVDGPPEPVSSLSPEAASEGVSLSPVYEWSPLPGAATYDIQIARDSLFSQIVASVNGIGQAQYEGPPLLPYTRYFYRVRGRNICGASPWSSTIPFRTSAIRCDRLQAAQLPVAIPSNEPGVVTSAIQTELSGTIASVALNGLDIAHTFVGDLSAFLRSPEGEVVQLFDRPGHPLTPFGCPGNDLLLSFSDQATGSPSQLENECGNEPAIAGSYRPATPFSSLIGASASGTWRLVLTDHFNQDGGQLNDWELEVCTTYPATAEIFMRPGPITICQSDTIALELLVGAGFSGPVSLFALGLQDGVYSAFSAQNIAPGASATLYLGSFDNIGPRTFLLYATDGDNTHVCEVSLLVKAPPHTPLLIAPADASPVFYGQENFSWGNAIYADSFRLEIARDTLFTDLAYTGLHNDSYTSLPAPLEAGLFFWRVTALSECGNRQSEVFSFYQEGPTTGARSAEAGEIALYPNPAMEQLHLALPYGASKATLYVFRIDGGLMLKQTIGRQTAFQVQDWPSGVYLFKVMIDGRPYFKRAIVQH
ncbi:trypsin-like peptidase domain-containing protein [Phaeodactylibacter luteus]|uniref:T9SS type A sorting domain-containing protein n=1 Tax=Phaeodactylibacter luteus TaxID=1564516 RepID=A0A5C6RKP8_9BACT|nr:trypsin-like peptidase domain-containing protein [Phaeodactylibacter luteus]TXB62489.1 T9SS type A sorting domain-containing protein [Phaeodactylibacter luteus]